MVGFGDLLTSLDLTTNTLLASLICHDYFLTNLDVSANDSLEYLICSGLTTVALGFLTIKLSL